LGLPEPSGCPIREVIGLPGEIPSKVAIHQ
jgi:hypothetical protein